jgi:hypothetical protein
MAAGAQQGAESPSSAPLQVLSEFVQNANDARAGQLRVQTELDTLATALHVKTDDLLKASPHLAPWRPAVGIAQQLTDAELVTLAMLQAMLGFTPLRPGGSATPIPICCRVRAQDIVDVMFSGHP